MKSERIIFYSKQFKNVIGRLFVKNLALWGISAELDCTSSSLQMKGVLWCRKLPEITPSLLTELPENLVIQVFSVLTEHREGRKVSSVRKTEPRKKEILRKWSIVGIHFFLGYKGKSRGLYHHIWMKPGGLVKHQCSIPKRYYMYE